jgi:hypothetical protein
MDSVPAEYRKVVRLAITAGERGLDQVAFFEELRRSQPMLATARRDWNNPERSPTRVSWPGIGSRAQSAKHEVLRRRGLR